MAEQVENQWEGVEVVISLSPQAVDLLEQLTDTGLYGLNLSEVASRFVDKGLIALLEKQVNYLDLKLKKQRRKRNG